MSFPTLNDSCGLSARLSASIHFESCAETALVDAAKMAASKTRKAVILVDESNLFL
jgi:hypothetical protein